MYNKGESRAQRIIVESIKYHLLPFVVDLKTSMAMYGNLVIFTLKVHKFKRFPRGINYID